MSDGRFEIDERSLAGSASLASTENGTAQLVIVHGGEIVVDETVTNEPVDVYAVQKGLVSVMFGIAEDHGLVRLDDPVSDMLGVGWTHLDAAAEARVTIRTVLDMTTGMDDELRPLGEVGVAWRYNNVAYNYLKTVLEVVTGRSLAEATAAWVLEPLGMTSTSWVERPVYRPDGKPITGMVSTAHDIARFGAAVLADDGGIAPPHHLRALGRPGSDENPSWGLCWWNNDQAHHRLPRADSDLRDGPLIPEAPADTIVARGAIENRLYVVRSLDLVVAHTAAPVRGERPPPFDQPFWTALSQS